MNHHEFVGPWSHPLLVHHVAKKLGLSRRMVRHLAETGVSGSETGQENMVF